VSVPTSSSPSAATLPDPATSAARVAQDIQTIADDVASAADTVAKASLWTALLGFFTALPGLVQLALQFWAWAEKVSGGTPGTLIANFGSDLAALSNAKTVEDRNAAVQSIANRFARLP